MSFNGFVRVSYGLDRNKNICKIKIKPVRPPRFFSENLTIKNQFILHGLTRHGPDLDPEYYKKRMENVLVA